jgi:type III pantothenate kinase
MLLAIDIGNTNIAAGVFEGETLRATWNIATDINKTADEYAVLLLNLLPREGLALSDIDHVSIACVVPPLLTIFEELSQRVVNTAAAHRLYGGPLIVIDFGTATTLDAVSKEGDYLGGAIAPGIGIAAAALFERASKLPRVELIPPQHAIGKDTVASMQSGIIFGYVGLIESMVTRMRQELGGEARVVATGGFAEVIATETRVIDVVNLHLTLIGLRLIHDLNR